MALAGLIAQKSCSIATENIPEFASFQATMDKRLAFSREVDSMLQPGRQVSILEGSLTIEPKVKPRYWPATIDSFFNYSKNQAPYQGKLELINPLVLSTSPDPTLVFYPQDRRMPLAIVVTPSLDRGIVTPYSEQNGILSDLSAYKKEVKVCLEPDRYTTFVCIGRNNIGISDSIPMKK